MLQVHKIQIFRCMFASIHFSVESFIKNSVVDATGIIEWFVHDFASLHFSVVNFLKNSIIDATGMYNAEIQLYLYMILHLYSVVWRAS